MDVKGSGSVLGVKKLILLVIPLCHSIEDRGGVAAFDESKLWYFKATEKKKSLQVAVGPCVSWLYHDILFCIPAHLATLGTCSCLAQGSFRVVYKQ